MTLVAFIVNAQLAVRHIDQARSVRESKIKDHHPLKFLSYSSLRLKGNSTVSVFTIALHLSSGESSLSLKSLLIGPLSA